MTNAGYDALGLDWQTDIQKARARVGSQVALQATWIRSLFTRNQNHHRKSQIHFA